MEAEVIVGTNEEFILGYSVTPNKDGTYNLQSSFTSHSHLGRVKNVALKGKYLASGSTDEDIRIYNLETRQEVGCLSNHHGSVTCLEFHESGFLFSGSDDGKISIFERATWKLVAELMGHKSGIVDLAIHPSGKLALSISKNKQMFLWDLRKGKKAFVNVLPKPCDLIQWSRDGSAYLIASSNSLFIYDAATGYIVNTYDFKNSIHCFCYLTDNLIAVGGECKDVAVFDVTSMEEVVRWDAHEYRTKALVKMESEDDSCSRFFSASSDGFIKMWCIDLELTKSKHPVKLIGEINSKCRIICMAFTSRESRIAYEEKRENTKKQYISRRQKKTRKVQKKWSQKRSHENDDASESKETQIQKKIHRKPKTKLGPSTRLQQLEEEDSTEHANVTKKKDVFTSAEKDKDSVAPSGKKRKLKNAKISNKKRKVGQNSSKKQKLLQENVEKSDTEILCREVTCSSKGKKKLKKKNSKLSDTSVQEDDSTTPTHINRKLNETSSLKKLQKC